MKLQRSAAARSCCISAILAIVGCAGGGAGTAGNQTFSPSVALSNPYSQVIRYPVGAAPRFIAFGPDKRLWFSDGLSTVGKVSLDGVVTTYHLSTGLSASFITKGPDGAMWFTEPSQQRVGRISLSGNVVEFLLPANGSSPYIIISGNDGNLWFTMCGQSPGTGRIGRITPSGLVSEFALTNQVNSYACPQFITNGPDGAIWYSVDGGYIARITTDATPRTTAFYIGGLAAMPLTRGPDHNLWYTNQEDGAPNSFYLGRLSPNGANATFVFPGSPNPNPQEIVVGPDNNFWISDTTDNALWRVTTTGIFTKYLLNAGVGDIAKGPDGNLWMSGANEVDVWVMVSIVVSPDSFSISTGQDQTVNVSETNYANTFVATTSNASVATVAVGGSSNTFVVHGLSAGSCIVLISDKRGNSFPVSVSVN